jgi:hypothetical protein
MAIAIAIDVTDATFHTPIFPLNPRASSYMNYNDVTDATFQLPRFASNADAN